MVVDVRAAQHLRSGISGNRLSRKPQDELTGNIEIENLFLLHGAFDQFLASLIHHQDFPLLGGRAPSVSAVEGLIGGVGLTSLPPALRIVFSITIPDSSRSAGVLYKR